MASDKSTRPLDHWTATLRSLLYRRPLSGTEAAAILVFVFYIATGLPMPWWATGTIWLALWACISYVAWSSTFTVSLHWLFKGALCLLAAVLVVLVGQEGVRNEYKQAHPLPASSIEPSSLETLFDTDFPYANIGRAFQLAPANNVKLTVIVKSRLFLDFDARSEILSLYVPYQTDSDLSFIIAGGMAERVAEIVDPNSDINKQFELNSSLSHPGESTGTPSKDLLFSGRLYLYVENELTDTQKAIIENQYTAHNIAVEIRGSSWEALHASDKRPFPLTAHLGTDVYHITYTTPSSQLMSQGDRLGIRMRGLTIMTPTKSPVP